MPTWQTTWHVASVKLLIVETWFIFLINERGLRKRGKSGWVTGIATSTTQGAPASALQTAPWQRPPPPGVPLGWVQPAFASSLLSPSGLSSRDSSPSDGHTLQLSVFLWKQPMLFNSNDKINNYSQRCLFKAYDVLGTVPSSLNTLTHLILFKMSFLISIFVHHVLVW